MTTNRDFAAANAKSLARLALEKPISQAAKEISSYVCANCSPKFLADYYAYLERINCLENTTSDNAIDALVETTKLHYTLDKTP